MGLPVATMKQLEDATLTLCNQTWSEVRPAPLLQRFAEGLASHSRLPVTHLFYK